MIENIELLKHIISKSKSLSIFVDNDIFYYEFEKEVINQFYNFVNSQYYYMLMIYPVIFMHISYYIIFKKFVYGSDSIFDFMDLFIHYQKRNNIKYIEMLTAIYGKMNSFDNEILKTHTNTDNTDNIGDLINKMNNIDVN
jgi:hypothetical protein